MLLQTCEQCSGSLAGSLANQCLALEKSRHRRCCSFFFNHAGPVLEAFNKAVLILLSWICRPGQDFHNWKARVSNIIAGAVFATAVCWFLLPWYASDDQLLHLGEAYVNAAELIDSIYQVFIENCQNIAEVMLRFIELIVHGCYYDCRLQECAKLLCIIMRSCNICQMKVSTILC